MVSYLIPKIMVHFIYTVLIISFFFIWFICTIVCQFKGKGAAFVNAHIDKLGLVPIWTFFAPRPGTTDYHILYRDKTTDENVGEWTEISLLENRSWADSLWNPQKRAKKVLSDIIQSLVVTLGHYPKEEDRNHIMYSFAYIMVLHLVTQQESNIQQPAFRQFVLAESSGYLEEHDPGFILISRFHELN